MKVDIVLEPLKGCISLLSENKGIIHTDRGSQYTSAAFSELLNENRITHSMSSPGTPLDNAVVESFFKSLKAELVHPHKHKTKAEMNVLVQDYLDSYYPFKRIHSSLGMTPFEFEQKLLST